MPITETKTTSSSCQSTRVAHVSDPHCSMRLKTFAILLAFAGIILSVLGSLTCQYLGFVASSEDDADLGLTNDDNIYIFSANTTPIQSSTPQEELSWPLEGATKGWMGLFSYQLIISSNNTTDATIVVVSQQECIRYDPESALFTQAPYLYLSMAQFASILAPSVSLLALFIFLLQISQTCCCGACRNSLTVSLLLFISALFQVGTLLVFAEPELCKGQSNNNECNFGYGAWISVSAAISLFLSSVLLEWTPLLADCWMELVTMTMNSNDEESSTVENIKSRGRHDDTTNSILTDSSTDLNTPTTQNTQNEDPSLQKAEKIRGNLFYLAASYCQSQETEASNDDQKIFSAEEIKQDLENFVSSLQQYEAKMSERELSQMQWKPQLQPPPLPPPPMAASNTPVTQQQQQQQQKLKKTSQVRRQQQKQEQNGQQLPPWMMLPSSSTQLSIEQTASNTASKSSSWTESYLPLSLLPEENISSITSLSIIDYTTIQDTITAGGSLPSATNHDVEENQNNNMIVMEKRPYPTNPIIARMQRGLQQKSALRQSQQEYIQRKQRQRQQEPPIIATKIVWNPMLQK